MARNLTAVPSIVARAWLAPVCAVASACGLVAEYAYVPASPAWIDGHTVALLRVPSEAPAGEVHIEPLGLTEVASPGRAPIRAVRVRMWITNRADAAAWTIDTRHQWAEFPGAGRTRAVRVEADAGEPPVLALAQHERVTLDLYFPVPAAVTSEEQMPAFDVICQLTTATRIVGETTRFYRVVIAEGP